MHDNNTCKINEINEELSNDIEILAETWGCKCELNFENYTFDHVTSQKRAGIKKGRASGGFIVLFKNYLSKKVNIIKKSNNFVWIEVDGNLINYPDGNFLIVGTYIHDITSKYYNDDIFEELFSDILEFSIMRIHQFYMLGILMVVLGSWMITMKILIRTISIFQPQIYFQIALRGKAVTELAIHTVTKLLLSVKHTISK